MKQRTCPTCKGPTTVSDGGRIDEHANGDLNCGASGWNYTALTKLNSNSQIENYRG